jgi:citrate lyase gamma subunit
VRSDLWCEVEIRASGGLTIELTSRVEPYYGDSIRSQVGAIISAAGVEHARVGIEDQGALPFPGRPRRHHHQPRATDCVVRVSTYRVTSRSTSSTPACTSRTA